MFDKIKITDDNAKKISAKIYEDPQMLRALNLDLDKDATQRDINVYEAQKREFYRVVLCFMSIIELLDRRGDASYEAFVKYEDDLSRETLSGNYESHIARCREAETGDDDFLVAAANKMEHTRSDEWFVMGRIAALSTFEEAFEKMTSYCRETFV